MSEKASKERGHLSCRYVGERILLLIQSQQLCVGGKGEAAETKEVGAGAEIQVRDDRSLGQGRGRKNKEKATD